MKLLNEGPYTTIKLTQEEKERLAQTEELNPDGESYYNLEEDWFISNDPKFDPIDDGREDFWKDDKEYPFPFSLLLGKSDVNHHYDSYSESFLEENGLLHYFS